MAAQRSRAQLCIFQLPLPADNPDSLIFLLLIKVNIFIHLSTLLNEFSQPELTFNSSIQIKKQTVTHIPEVLPVPFRLPSTLLSRATTTLTPACQMVLLSVLMNDPGTWVDADAGSVGLGGA